MNTSIGIQSLIAITWALSGCPKYLAKVLTSDMNSSISSAVGSNFKFCHSEYRASSVLPLVDHLSMNLCLRVAAFSAAVAPSATE